MILRISPLFLPLLLLSCGAPQVRPDAQQPPISAEEALDRMPALERAGQATAMLDLAKRVAGQHPDRLQVAEIHALWLSGQNPQALVVENRWLEQHNLQTEMGKKQLLDLARWHLQRHAHADALRVLTRLRGLDDARALRLTATVLATWHPPEVAMLAADLAPKQQRESWLIALGQRLVQTANVQTARQYFEQLRDRQPEILPLWALALCPDRKQPTPIERTKWLTDLQKASISTEQLQNLATQDPVDKQTAAQVLALATQKPDASQTTWQQYAMALLRADDAENLQKLVTSGHFTTPESKLVLARALLGAKLPLVAQPLLADLPVDDAKTLILQAELERQLGHQPQADQLRQKALDTAKDRSEIALIAAQLQRRAGDPAQFLLTASANHPGLGQATAIRMRAREALAAPRKIPARTFAQYIADYAKVLTAKSVQESKLSDELPLDLPVAREELARQLENLQPTWTEPWLATLHTFADAGVAEPWMLRELALRALKEDDGEAFLTLDAQARRLADGQNVALVDDKLLNELANKPSPLLARWLAQLDSPQATEVTTTWKVAGTLLHGPFAWLGRQWAERALLAGQMPDLATSLVGTLSYGGAADLSLELLAKRQPLEPAQEIPWILAEANALLQLDRAEEASKKLATLMQRPEVPAKLLRPVVDLALEHGLCDAVMLAVPRLLTEKDDLYTWKKGAAAGLECARRHGKPEWLELVVQGAQSPQPDVTRIEHLARELGNAGFYERAAQVFGLLDKIRQLGPDLLNLWARALVSTGQTPEAVLALNRAVQSTHGRTTLYHQRAAEMLEDYAQFQQAADFWLQAVRQDPDNPQPRFRLILNQLRRGQIEPIAEHLPALLRAGPTPEMLDMLQQVAVRTGQVQPVYAALAEVLDADRETERLRLSLAAKLGLRDAVQAGVRRLRAKRAVQTAQVPGWLLAVGDRRTAREVAEDLLASPEPTGTPQDRPQTLRLALAERRDPTSEAEALSLTRYYLGRALDPQRAAMEAAVELARVGLTEPARAVSAMANQSDHPLRTCMQATFEHDAGHHAVAVQLWQKSMAAALLDPRMRDLLHHEPMRGREVDGDEVGLELQCLLTGLTESHEYTLLAEWMRDLLVVAPDSSMLRSRLFQVQLLRGDVPAAMAELQAAAQMLTELREQDWQKPCERLLRDGGGPLLLAWLVQEGDALRTEPWFLAFAATVLASQQPPGAQVAIARAPLQANAGQMTDIARTPTVQADPETLRQILRTLAPLLPALRIELALQASARGQAQAAAQVLGQGPLTVTDSVLGDAAKAVAAATIGLGATTDARPQLQQWLAHARGVDSQLAVAQELVLQGHPQLALAADPLPDAQNPAPYQLPMAQARIRALVALAAGDDDRAVVLAEKALRGVRSNLDQTDEAVLLLLRAGRVKAGMLLAKTLQESEPGLQPLALALGANQQENPVPKNMGLARAFRPEALADLRGNLAEMAEDQQEMLLRLAVAADPKAALKLTQARAQRDDEPWRPWWQLLTEAVAFEERDLAVNALTQAQISGVPAGMRTCPALWLRPEQIVTLQACIHGRSVDALPEDELADVATGIALGTDVSGTAAFFQQLQQAPQQTRGQFLAAAATRLWALTPNQQNQLREQIRAWLQRLPPSDRESLVVTQLDELAMLGLGDLGVALEVRVWQRDPDGRSERNNLAYAQFLAGSPLAQSLKLSEQAKVQMGGDAAYATLDTVASIKWALGDHNGALEAQLAALASLAAGPRNPEAGMALPIVRHAEFLLANGDLAEARVLAALVLQKPEEPATSQRARRVLKASLRGPAQGGR